MTALKYPRTYHFPFSPGATSDDKILFDWEEHLKDKKLIATEKLDGGNTQINKEGVFARSISGPTSHPSFDYLKPIWASIKSDLETKNISIFGENLFAIHSIEYTNLSSYFYVFGVKKEDQWLSWNEVKEIASNYGWPTVPELSIDFTNIEKEINKVMPQESILGGEKEGVVIRNANSFYNDDFKYNVLKFVRKNHVQTDKHWTKDWKQAKLSK